MSFFDPKLPDPMMWGWHDDAATAAEYPFQPSTDSHLEHPTSPHSMGVRYQSNNSNSGHHMTNGHKHGKSVDSMEVAMDPYNPFEKRFVLEPPKTQQQQQHQEDMIRNGLAWGSDPHFNQMGYQNPDVVDPAEDVHDRVHSLVGKPQPMTHDNTAMNSPVDVKHEQSAHNDDTEDDGSRSGSGDMTPSPRSNSHGRTLSEPNGEQHNGSSSSSTKSTARKGKARNGESSPKIGKKKNASKRDNLSEAQKRENHIQSEQKRRNLIRTGFEDLCTLVPELRGGGYSKSAVLIHAASFLEQLEEGNKQLRLQVSHLEGWS